MAKRVLAAWKPALFFLICLVIALFINMPARLMLHQFPVPSSIRITHLQGTLFSGEVSELGMDQLSFQQLTYRIDLSCLLTASVCYQLNYANGVARVRFEPITQTLRLHELDAELPLRQMAAFAGQLLVSPSGNLRIESDRLAIRQGKLVEIEATTTWTSAGIVGEDFDLGNYQLEITKDSEQYRFTLQDKDAVLDIDGKGKLSDDGNYDLNIVILAQAGLDSRIKNALELIAQKKGLNQYIIRRSGPLDGKLMGFLSFDEN